MTVVKIVYSLHFKTFELAERQLKNWNLKNLKKFEFKLAVRFASSHGVQPILRNSN